MNLTMKEKNYKHEDGKYYAFVYIRTLKLTDQSYVGQTNDINNRNNHFRSLKSKYAGKKLENARKKYGTTLSDWDLRVIRVEADTIENLEIKLDIKESAMMLLYDSVNNGYNSNYGHGIKISNKKTKKKQKSKAKQAETIALAA